MNISEPGLWDPYLVLVCRPFETSECEGLGDLCHRFLLVDNETNALQKFDRSDCFFFRQFSDRSQEQNHIVDPAG